MAEGKVEDAPALDEEQDVEAQQSGLDEADIAGGGGKTQTEREDEPDPGDTTEEQPETPEIPWDTARQAKDQEMANLRKTADKQTELLGGLTETVKQQNEMLTALRRGEKPIASVDVILEQLDSMEGFSEFEDPDAFAKYEAKRQRILGRLREARKAEVADRKAPAAKTALEQAAEDAKADVAGKDADPPTFTQEDFTTILGEADKRYGAEYRRAAAHAAVKELAGAGYKDGNVPSKALVREVVFRLYAERKAEVAGKAAAKTNSPKKPAKAAPTAASEESFGPEHLRTGRQTPEYQPATVDDLAEDMKARRARQGP